MVERQGAVVPGRGLKWFDALASVCGTVGPAHPSPLTDKDCFVTAMAVPLQGVLELQALLRRRSDGSVEPVNFFPLTPWNLFALLLGLAIGWLARSMVQKRQAQSGQEDASGKGGDRWASAPSARTLEPAAVAEDLRAKLAARTRELETARREGRLLKRDRDVLERDLARVSRGRSLRSAAVEGIFNRDFGGSSDALTGSWARHHHLDVLASQPEDRLSSILPPSEEEVMDALAVHQTGPRVRVRPSAVGPPGRRPSAYPLARVPEIEPRHVHRLRELGISTTYDLLMKAVESDGQRRLARELAHPGVTERVVRRWARLCDLMRIPGVSSSFAESLLGSGVDTVEELARQDSGKLFVRMTEEYMSAPPDQQGEGLPEPQQLEDWIEAAKILGG